VLRGFARVALREGVFRFAVALLLLFLRELRFGALRAGAALRVAFFRALGLRFALRPGARLRARPLLPRGGPPVFLRLVATRSSRCVAEPYHPDRDSPPALGT